MKKWPKMTEVVRHMIVADYEAINEFGMPAHTLKNIAIRNKVSPTSVINVLRQKRCRRRGYHHNHYMPVPDAKTYQILRDMTRPGVSVEDVGRLNPIIRTVNGKTVTVPRSRQQISYIVNLWKTRNKNFQIKSYAFQPGDIIEWQGRILEVTRYDNRHKGAVKDKISGMVWDPFCWKFNGRVSVLHLAAAKPLDEHPPESVPEQTVSG
jgi:hypothetical protein